jgi:hypothetical protein
MAGVTRQFRVPVGGAAPDGGHGAAARGSALLLDDGSGSAPASLRMEGGALRQHRSESAPFILARARHEGAAPFRQCRRDTQRPTGGPHRRLFLQFK